MKAWGGFGKVESMAIYKGFRLLFSTDYNDPLGTIVEDLGQVTIPILQSTGEWGTSNISWRLPGQTPTLGTYTSESDGNEMGVLIYPGEGTLSDRAADLLFAMEEVLLKVLVPSVDGYVILYDSEDVYAYIGMLSNPTSSGGGWFVSPVYGSLAIGFSYNNNVSNNSNRSISAGYFIGDIQGDTITDLYYEAGGSTGNQYNFATYTLAAIHGNTFKNNAIAFLNAATQPAPPSTDPYTQGGESDVGGGEGNFDGTSVDVDFTSLPNLSAVDTGFITLYNPTVAQLQALANYMWSGAFDLDTFKKLFADPMQAILGLSIVPGPVPSSGSQAVKVGNISTGISMTKAASQYIDVDCGTLNIEEFWGAYLDYEPYTKAEIYLPYIGTHQIAVDDIMGKAVHIKYHIDILSGACAAEIKCGGSVLYTFIGSVSVSIPITGSDWTNVINGVLSIAGAVGSLVATGGASAPAAAGEIASAAVNSLKPNIEKSGSVSGGGGLMAGKVPVLILTRPRQALPASQNSFTGYPAFITRSLGAVSGYTEVHKIRLGGISATDAELDEIKNLLKGGVIL